MFKSANTYDNQTGKYNGNDALLIETDAQACREHVHYQDCDRNVSVTTVAAHMGKEEDRGTNMKWGNIQLGPSWEWQEVCVVAAVEPLKKKLANNITEIYIKEQGLEPSSPRFAERWPADEQAWMTHGCMVITWCPCDQWWPPCHP